MVACRFSLFEPIEFIRTHLKDKLEWSQVRDSVAIHVPCSSKKMGVTAAFSEIAGLCAKEVTPSDIPCCGESPTLSAALRVLVPEARPGRCSMPWCSWSSAFSRSFVC